MDTTHLKAFAAAMQRKNLDAMLMHMADDAVLRTPLVAEAFIGKAAIRPVVEALFRAVDTFELIEMMQGSEHASQFFRVTAGSEHLDGVDYWRLNDAGLIQEMTVLWRPLPAVVAVQARLDALEPVPR